MASAGVLAMARATRVQGAILIAVPLLSALTLTALRGPGPLMTVVGVAPLVVIAQVSHLVCDVVGYRLRPLDPALPVDLQQSVAMTRFRRSALARGAIIAPTWVYGLAAALATRPTAMQIFLIAASMSAFLTYLHAWPNRRVLRRSEAPLAAAGAGANLARMFRQSRRSGPE